MSLPAQNHPTPRLWLDPREASVPIPLFGIPTSPPTMIVGICHNFFHYINIFYYKFFNEIFYKILTLKICVSYVNIARDPCM